MNNTNFDCTLNDLTELRQLIIENPELPLLIFCGEDSWHDEWSYEQAMMRGKPCIDELILYKDCWVDKDDYEEKLRDDLCDWEEYKDLSDAEYDKMIEQKIAETEFVKAIVIYVG